ncbi:MAG: hypothetical protein P8Z35_11640 [Ignavibacteriaceae bacterium]|jgi:hypothetical protein
MKKKKVKLLFIAIFLLFLIIFPYQLLWGKLFPYSPVKIGFTKYELPHITIYKQNGSQEFNYKIIDSLIAGIEAFHKMSFTQKPEIIFFKNRDSYLQRNFTKARFCAYPNGTLVVSPWAVREALDGEISMKIYLKHELSHTLLYQHMDFITAYFYYPRWLLEGIAVYSSNQMGTSWYPGKDETYNYIRNGNFLPPEYFNTSDEDKIKLNMKNKIAFIYSEFGCIVDYLIENYGKEKFVLYITRLLNSHQRIKCSKIYMELI